MLLDSNELMLLALNETRSIKFEASAPEIDAFGHGADIPPPRTGAAPSSPIPPHLFLLLTPENSSLVVHLSNLVLAWI